MLLIAYNAHTSYEMAGILTHVGIEDLSHIQPDASSPISISRFALLQSTSFLFTLTSTPKLSQTESDGSTDFRSWLLESYINSSRQNIASAIKVISIRKKKALNEDEIDEDE